MPLKTRVANLEQSRMISREPLITLLEIFTPGKRGPVSKGYHSAYTLYGSIYPNEGETDAEFEARATRLSEGEGA